MRRLCVLINSLSGGEREHDAEKTVGASFNFWALSRYSGLTSSDANSGQETLLRNAETMKTLLTGGGKFALTTCTADFLVPLSRKSNSEFPDGSLTVLVLVIKII